MVSMPSSLSSVNESWFALPETLAMALHNTAGLPLPVWQRSVHMRQCRSWEQSGKGGILDKAGALPGSRSKGRSGNEYTLGLFALGTGHSALQYRSWSTPVQEYPSMVEYP
jgi:hypothetical protein